MVRVKCTVQMTGILTCTNHYTTLCMQIEVYIHVYMYMYVPFVEGDDISATTPLDTALDSGNPCGSRDVDDRQTSGEPANDEGQ